MKKHFTYNFITKTIVGSKTSIERANKGLAPEYSELSQMLALHPDFSVAEKIISHNSKKKTYKKLTLLQMKEYIEIQPDSTNKLIEFEAVQKVAAAKNAKYPLTKKWFLKNYPEYSENEISDEQTECLIAAGADALAKAGAALADIELTEDDYEEDEENIA